jgi:hypothetical protein
VERRPPLRRLRRALLALLLVAAVVAGAGPAGAQTGADPTGAGTAGPSLQLVSQSAWVAPSGAMELRFLPVDIPAGATLSVQVHPAVGGRIAFDESTQGVALGSPLRGGPAPFQIGAVPALADGSYAVTIPVSRTSPAPEGGVTLSSEGVYPVVVSATVDGSEVAELITHLVRLPTTDVEGPALGVGLVAEIDGTVLVGEDGVPELDDAEATRAAGTIAALAAQPAVPLTVAATPSVVEVLAAGEQGVDGPAPVQGLAAALAGRQVLASPYVQLDQGAWIAEGLVAELDRQVAVGAEVAVSTLGVRPDGRTAVADPTLTPAAMAHLHALGVEQLVVPNDQLAPIPGAEISFTRAFQVLDGDGNALDAVVADVELSRRLRATGDPVLDAHRTVAELAVLYNDQPAFNRGVALEVPSDVDARALATLLEALAERVPPGGDGRQIISPLTLDDLFRTTEEATDDASTRTTTLQRAYEAQPPGSLGAYPAELADVERQLDGFRSMVPELPQVTVPLDRAVLLSGAIGMGPDQRGDALGWVTSEVDAASQEVLAPLQEYVTLTSRSGNIPLNLENRLPYPVTVHVVVRSVRLDFPEGNVIPVELPAAATTRVEVGVTTRSSGSFPIEVSVRSPDEVLELSTSRFTVRSTAISGIGLVLSIGAGVFLLVWWARHWRKVRRARQLVSSDHPAFGSARPAGGGPTTDDAGAGAEPTATPVGAPRADDTGAGGAEALGYAPSDTD